MKKLLFVLLLSLELLAGSLQLQSGSIQAHASMMMDSGIKPLNNNLSAEINIQDENIETLSGQFWIDLNSFTSDKKDRDKDMYETLETLKFKLATFTIMRVEKTEQKDIYTINGKLNFHGIENELSAKANISFKDGIMTLNATSMINMPSYGVEMPCLMFICVRDRVDLEISATFSK